MRSIDAARTRCEQGLTEDSAAEFEGLVRAAHEAGDRAATMAAIDAAAEAGVQLSYELLSQEIFTYFPGKTSS